MRELNLSKKNWNLKRIWITPKSVSDFHAVLKMFTFVRNEISNIILRERCSVLTYDTSFSPVNFFYPFYSLVIALCVV